MLGESGKLVYAQKHVEVEEGLIPEKEKWKQLMVAKNVLGHQPLQKAAMLKNVKVKHKVYK